MTRERRWVVISEDGRHASLGQHTDPSEEEITRVEVALAASGTAGWLAVTEGVYYSHDVITVLQVRVLGTPSVSWEEASSKFLSLRDAATDVPLPPAHRKGSSDPRSE